MDNGISIADALALQNTGRNDGMFGNNGTWVFFLFFLLAWGGNGFGFNGNNQALTQAELQAGFMNNNVISKLDGISNGICSSTFALNNTMQNGFFNQEKCCCETNRNIDALRYENSKNTCDIINAIRIDGEATRALINSNTMQELRDNLQAAQLQLGNISQTQNILTAIGRYVTNPPCNPCPCCNM